MVSVENTEFNKEILLKISYPFGNIFIFETFVVSEINEGVKLTWENLAEIIAKDFTDFFKTDGSDIVYISHRINDYSTVPLDWTKFFNAYKLKAYCVVSQSEMRMINAKIDNFFIKNRTEMGLFQNLHEAINWVKTL